MNYCPDCGAHVESGHFCSDCGAALTGVPEGSTIYPNDHFKPILGMAIALLAVGFVGLFLVFGLYFAVGMADYRGDTIATSFYAACAFYLMFRALAIYLYIAIIVFISIAIGIKKTSRKRKMLKAVSICSVVKIIFSAMILMMGLAMIGGLAGANPADFDFPKSQLIIMIASGMVIHALLTALYFVHLTLANKKLNLFIE